MPDHTNGPWKAFSRLDAYGLPEIVVTADNGCPIAVVANHAEFKANSHLIAAAPELLDFVRGHAKRDPVFAKGLEKKVIADAIALVAKAEGRS